MSDIHEELVCVEPLWSVNTAAEEEKSLWPVKTEAEHDKMEVPENHSVDKQTESKPYCESPDEESFFNDDFAYDANSTDDDTDKIKQQNNLPENDIFTCDICQRQLKSKRNLRRHFLIHTKPKVKVIRKRAPRIPQNEPSIFICDVCKKE